MIILHRIIAVGGQHCEVVAFGAVLSNTLFMQTGKIQYVGSGRLENVALIIYLSARVGHMLPLIESRCG